MSSSVGPSLTRIVAQSPGIHFRALERAANLSSAGQLRHHIDRLQREGVLVEVTDGGYTRYFLANQQDRHLRPWMARFARDVPRRIGRLLLQRPMTRSELRRGIGCADSTLGYYLDRMERHGDLVKQKDGPYCIFELADPDTVRQVLLAQEIAAGGPNVRPVWLGRQSRQGS